MDGTDFIDTICNATYNELCCGINITNAVEYDDAVHFIDDACNDHFEFQYPIINVFWNHTWTPYDSPKRMGIFLVGHSIFFVFNLINVMAILLVSGVIFRRLHENHLMQSALLACTGQMFSCLNSTYRYNKCEEFGIFGASSIYVGLAGYFCLNYTTLHIFLNRHIAKRLFDAISLEWIGIFIWAGLTIASWVLGLKNQDKPDYYFQQFRIYISLSTAFQLLSYISILWSWKAQTIRLRDEIAPFVSHDFVTRLLYTAIALVVLTFALAATQMPVLQFPATGMSFSVVVMVVSVVGEMDFMECGYQRRNKSSLSSLTLNMSSNGTIDSNDIEEDVELEPLTPKEGTRTTASTASTHESDDSVIEEWRGTGSMENNEGDLELPRKPIKSRQRRTTSGGSSRANDKRSRGNRPLRPGKLMRGGTISKDPRSKMATNQHSPSAPGIPERMDSEEG